MPKPDIIIVRTKLYKLAEAVFLLLLGLYLIFMAKNTTRYSFLFDDGAEGVLLTLLRIAVIIKSVLFIWNRQENYKNNKTYLKRIVLLFILAMIIRIIYYMIYRCDKYTFLLFLSVLVVGAIGTDYRKIMKTHIIAVGLFTGSAVLSSLSGLIVNNAYLQDGLIRSTWGILSPTDFGAVIFYLCLVSWMAWKEVDSRLFLLFGCICLLNAIFIARSNTSTIMSFLLILCMTIDGISLKKGKKLVAISLQLVFPILSFLTFGIEYLYHTGTTVGIKLDRLFHNRFALIDSGFAKHKISLFGKPFSQIGFGGSTFYKTGYNFIDSSYVLVLLRYGVVLFLVMMILWVLMTRKAVKMGHWRLAFGMALIAINAFSEHHFLEVNYNILIILPFSVLGMGWIVEEKHQDNKLYADRRFFAGFTTSVITVLCIIAIGPRFLSIFRTIFDIMRDKGILKEKEMLICAMFMLMIVCMIIVISNLYKVICLLADKYRNRNVSIRRIIFPAAILFIMISSFLVAIALGNRIIDRKGALYMDGINEEKAAIDAVMRGIRVSNGCFFVDEVPSIYKNKYSEVSESFFQGDELAERLNTTVLMDADYESLPFIAMGFLYTEISDDHALYTNDSAVIKELELAGYHMTGYYSRKRIVDMENQAELNKLELTSSGGVVVKDPDKQMWRGPFFDLRGGIYTITYELSLPEVSVYKSDYKVCTLVIMARYGTDKITEVPVYRKDFDEAGNYVATIKISISDCEASEFKLYAESGQAVIVDGISCQKTPDVDAHAQYDKEGRIIRKAFFDLEGNKIDTSEGYHVVEYEYDQNNNVSQYWYYDKDGKPVIIKLGYAGIGKRYDEKKRVTKEIYYGEKHERISFDKGQSAVKYRYDAGNRINEYRYYDTNDKLMMRFDGYAILRREFNDKGKVVYEAYYDTEDRPVLLGDGYSSVRYSYDEDGREYNRCFYDEEGKPVVTTLGYAERQLTYDINGRIIIEEYYDASGERITFDTGVSIVEYNYDMYGNRADIYYYDADAKPAMRYGAYHHIGYIFNSKGQIIYETLYDMDERSIVHAEGYVTIEREYDEYGNILKYRYLDVEGNPVMRTDGFAKLDCTYDDIGNLIEQTYLDFSDNLTLNSSGYAVLCREYDSANHMTKEYYLDTTRTLVDCFRGYASIVNIYDESGNLVSEIHYNTKGEVVDVQ